MDINKANNVVNLVNSINYYKKQIESWEDKINNKQSTILGNADLNYLIEDCRNSLKKVEQELELL